MAANPPLPIKYILGFFKVCCPVSREVYESRFHPGYCTIFLTVAYVKGYNRQCKLPDILQLVGDHGCRAGHSQPPTSHLLPRPVLLT